MIKFGTLIIEGFCSIQHLELNLDSRGVVFIKGRNGSGKSTILNALIWILFGKTLKPITKILTWEEERTPEYMGVKGEVFWEKEGIIHRVIRCCEYKSEVYGAKGANRLIYFKDGDIIEEKGKTTIQALIEKDLGFSFRLFKNSIAFGQKMKRLSQETGPDKKALFEEAFDLGYLSVAKAIAKIYKEDYEAKYREQSIEVNHLILEYAEVKESYIDLRSREKSFREILKREISELNEERGKLIEKRKTIIKKFDQNLLTKAHRKIAELNEAYNKIIAKEKLNKLEISKYDNKEGLSEFINNVITLLENNKISKAIKNLKSIKSLILGLEAMGSDKNIIFKKLEKARGESSKYKELKDEIITLDNDITDIDREITRVKCRKQEVISPKYRKKRVDTKLKMIKLKAELVETQKALEKYEWVYSDPLGNSGIKTYIFDASLNALNEILDLMTPIIGFRVCFTIDGDSKKRDFVTLIQKGEHDAQYEELSGGEQQLVDIAMLLALHCTTTASNGVNIIFFDEVFESLDKDNQPIVMDMVKKIWEDGEDKSIYIISHRDFVVSNSKTLNMGEELDTSL